MKHIRVIPKLDIKGPNLVKGIHLEGLRVLGKPSDFAKYYYESGADELIYIDVVASLYGRNSLLNIIEKTANEIFIPLTVGGGIRTIDDMKKILRAGADKISLNTAAVKNPNIISEAAQKFGSSTIVISIEAVREYDGAYRAFTDNGREETGLEVYEWAKRVSKLGAGEILLTSIDREGTGKGYDIELTKRIAEAVEIPVIALGGAGTKEHIKEVITEGKADAVSIASILHYDYARKIDINEKDFTSEGNLEFIKEGRHFSKIKPATLPEVKAYLNECGIPCRYAYQKEKAHAGR